MSPREILSSKWFKFGFWGLLYLLWVIWLGNFWWLFGLAVIFDACVSRKVHWCFWRKKGVKKQGAVREWIDALVFAVVVVTFINMFFLQAFKIPSSSMEGTLYTGDQLFVSKLAYGPRVPQTPLTIPFTHNVLPGGGKSYSTLIQNRYRRLAGWGQVQRGDIVVFCFPNGDTVLTRNPAADYYAMCRLYGRKQAVRALGPVMVHPKDKKDHYVKRCVGLPGDEIQLVDGVLSVNGQVQEPFPGQQTSYRVTCASRLNGKLLERLGVNVSETFFDASLPGYPSMALTACAAAELARINGVSLCGNVDRYPVTEGGDWREIFPYVDSLHWTRDNYGPLRIPRKGQTVRLDASTLPFYRRIITAYEGHALEERDGGIFIDGETAVDYTFSQDYYFMMGDNRHNSLDSRYWGFVPEDHIVGKPRVIWFSSDPGRRFPENIRWRRLFKFV